VTATLLDRCRLVVTMDDANRELTDCSIAIEDGWIVSLDGQAADRPFDHVVDSRRLIVLPGLINAHHHLYQTLARGFPQSEGRELFAWLEMLYPIWAGLDEDMIHSSTRAGLAELALSGCTTAADHLYVFPAGSDRFIDAEVEAARSIGVRFHPTRGSMDLGRDRGGLPPNAVVQPTETILADSERVVGHYHDPSPGALLQVSLAPCSPFSVTPELMKETATLARRLGVRLHTHIAETRDEDRYSRETFGLSPIELLESLDWLGEDVWVAHCVHPSPADVGRMRRGPVGVAHCPTSNMLLGSGLAPIPDFLRAGIPVGLGVDGSASNDGNDLKGEVKQAVLSARARDGARALSVRQALHLATRGGAACLGRSDIGSLEAGKCADLVTFDADALEVTGSGRDPLAGVLLGGARPRDVMVHGRWVVRDGNLVGKDVEEIAREQTRQSDRLLARSTAR
jgi:8-oxoguanine deaminase